MERLVPRAELVLVQALETTGIKPVVDRVFEFEEAPAALRYCEDAKPLGKVVIGR